MRVTEMTPGLIALAVVAESRCNHMTDRMNLMKVLSEKQVLECKDATWFVKTTQRCRYDKLDVLIETLEKLT